MVTRYGFKGLRARNERGRKSISQNQVFITGAKMRPYQWTLALLKANLWLGDTGVKVKEASAARK